MKLIKDSIWNLASIGIPAILAIPIFSLISKNIGLELFGIYTLSFAIIGYASIFDLGLSRSVIREVAINISNFDEINKVIDTAYCMILMLSGLACLSVLLFSNFIVSFIRVSNQHYYDVLVGMRLLALCLPLLLISNIWLAYFEGLSKFKALSIFRVVSSSLIILLPYFTIQIHSSFTTLVMGLVVARLITFIITFFWIKKYLIVRLRFFESYAKKLLIFGGWLTVSTIISPIMVYFDRFILSSIIGAKNVAFYTAPSELVMRLLSLPSAVSRALFTRFSNTPKGNENTIYWLGIIGLTIMSTFIAIPLMIFAETLMVKWMGESFKGEPVKVFCIMLIGFIFNSVAQMPFTSLQAKGLSKLTALVHCYEVIPYLVILYALTMKYGLIGMATAWTSRIIADTLIFLYFDKRKRELT